MSRPAAERNGDLPATLLIEAEELTKHYGPVAALQGVSLRVRAGEVVALIGPNGAGKSTLLKALVGLVKPTAGRARVAGHPAGSVAAKAAVGFLPQRLALPENVEVVEALQFFAGLRVSGAAPERLDAAVDAVIEAVGLTDVRHRLIRELSGGMLQRVGLAQVMLGDPPVLLLDEPALNLDIEGRQRLRAVLDGVRQRGGCALVSSHLLEEALHSADRVVVLQAGRVLADESVAAMAARLESRLYVAVDSPIPALRCLEQHGYAVRSDVDSRLVVACSAEQAVRVLDMLQREGFSVREFRLARMSLEELVMSYLQAGRDSGRATSHAADGG